MGGPTTVLPDRQCRCVLDNMLLHNLTCDWNHEGQCGDWLQRMTEPRFPATKAAPRKAQGDRQCPVQEDLPDFIARQTWNYLPCVSSPVWGDRKLPQGRVPHAQRARPCAKRWLADHVSMPDPNSNHYGLPNRKEISLQTDCGVQPLPHSANRAPTTQVVRLHSWRGSSLPLLPSQPGRWAPGSGPPLQ